MKKCDSCANRGTGWCRGCEHRCPGLEQYDFYQETTEGRTAPNADPPGSDQTKHIDI